MSDERKQLINCLNTNYGIEVASLTFLPLGADMDATVYKVESVERYEYFLKVKRAYNHEMSLAVTKLLHEAGLTHILQPIKTLHGRDVLSLGDAIVIVYPFIKGEDGFRRDLTDEQWIGLGKALRSIHDVTVPESLQRKIRKETFQPIWRNRVRTILSQLDGTHKLLSFMKEKREAIEQILFLAETLAAKHAQEPHEPVLCHADIHGGNVLIDDNHGFYIVDWDDPMMAPKERDLMFIGGGVANVWNRAHEEALFYQGYGKLAVNQELIAYYRNERIVEDIALIYDLIFLSVAEASEKEISYEQFVAMFAPDGVVEIALRS